MDLIDREKLLDDLHSAYDYKEYINEQPQINLWTSIKDELPPEKTEILFKIKNGRKYVGRIIKYSNGECSYRCITARGSDVTGIIPVAWMYIPE